MGISRREFIKYAALGLAGSAALTTEVFKPLSAMGLDDDRAIVKHIPTVCEMCFWMCGAVGRVVNGRLVKLEGNPLHPKSRGRLCARGNAGMGLLYDPDRLKAPLIRTGARGENRYKKASWDEALNYVADRITKIKEKYGPEAIALFAHGSPGSYFFDLVLAMGSPNISFPSFSQCLGARNVGYELTFGEDPGSGPERVDMENSRVIAMFATHLGENMHNSQVQDFTEAVGRGAKLIVVDPRFSTAAGKADYWLQIKPGTDLALMLAWLHVLIYEKWYDEDYIKKYTEGFEELKKGVKEYTPEWAEKETEIPARLIAETARELGRYRPNVVVHPGRHYAWYGNDTQRARANALLNAVLGTWGAKGGIYLKPQVKLPSLKGKPFPETEKESVAIPDKYPFAGGEGLTNEVRRATITGDPYPIKAWLVVGTNLVKTLPNQKETLQAIKNLDLLVSIDVMPMDTTMLADVILPETTYLERHDELKKVYAKSLGIALRQPVVKPLFEVKPAWWIAKELAKRLGLEDYFPYKHLEDKLRKQAKLWNIDYDKLQRKGYHVIPNSAKPYFGPDNPPKFKTESGKINLYSKELEAYGFDPIPKYTKVEQPPQGYMRLLYGRVPMHTFTRSINNKWLWELEKENHVWINTEVARRLNIKDGEYVVLENQDGIRSNKVLAKVTERIRKDCVFLPHGFGLMSKRLSRAYLKGADDQGLITRYRIDPITGVTGMRVNFVKIVKEA